jgi:uncharacterized protein (DUF433 family)
MRITVGTILGLLATDASRDEILAAYPYLEAEDIRQALRFAALEVRHRKVLDERIKALEAGVTELIPWAEAKLRLHA